MPFREFPPDFLAAHAHTEGRTLVDGSRCYDLWTLLGEAHKVPGDIIEVGVWRGGTGYLLCERASQLGGKKQVWLCDTFTGVVKTGDKDSTYKGGEHADADAIGVATFLNRRDLWNYVIAEGVFPDETGGILEETQFCFAHIDVDAYQSAKDSFEFIAPRMPPGGIVVFDDYRWPACDGITALVEELKRDQGWVFVHTVPWHAVFVKTV